MNFPLSMHSIVLVILAVLRASFLLLLVKKPTPSEFVLMHLFEINIVIKDVTAMKNTMKKRIPRDIKIIAIFVLLSEVGCFRVIEYTFCPELTKLVLILTNATLSHSISLDSPSQLIKSPVYPSKVLPSAFFM
jgi:hypothetical protein